jgi:hypothetical protein
MPVCNAPVTNRESTSSVADSDAAEVCARSIEGSALLARLLAQAATISFTAWCNSSALRWIFSRLSRSVRETACSTPFGSPGIPVLRASANSPRFDYWNCTEELSTLHQTHVSAGILEELRRWARGQAANLNDAPQTYSNLHALSSVGFRAFASHDKLTT